jgi:hypothetical protein
MAVRRCRGFGLGAVVTAVMVLTVVVLGATTALAQTQPGGDATKAFAKYRTCLAKHGVKLPKNGVPGAGNSGGVAPNGNTPPPSGGTPPSLPKGVTRKKFNKAMKACRSKLPKGARNGGPNGGAASFQAYLSCLRDHGVDVPASNGGSRPPSFDQNDPTFAAASKICAPLAPAGSPSTTAPPTD